MTRDLTACEAERARLELIVIGQQARLAKQDRIIEDLKAAHVERGRTTTRLNKDLQAALRKLRNYERD